MRRTFLSSLKVNDIQSLMDEAYLKKKGASKKFAEIIQKSTNRHIVRRGINSGKDIVTKDSKLCSQNHSLLAQSCVP